MEMGLEAKAPTQEWILRSGMKMESHLVIHKPTPPPINMCLFVPSLPLSIPCFSDTVGFPLLPFFSLCLKLLCSLYVWDGLISLENSLLGVKKY